MWPFGSSRSGEPDGYGEAPINPNYNQLSNLHFVRIMDKISSKGARQPRTVLLSSRALVICQTGSFAAKRIVPLSKVASAVVQENPLDARLTGPAEGCAVLLKIPTEHDIVLAQPRQRKAGYAKKANVEHLVQVIHAAKRLSKEPFTVRLQPPGADLFREANLRRGPGVLSPQQRTFMDLDEFFEPHSPLPDGVKLEELKDIAQDESAGVGGATDQIPDKKPDPVSLPLDTPVDPPMAQAGERAPKPPSHYNPTPSSASGHGLPFEPAPHRQVKSTFGTTAPAVYPLHNHFGEWRGEATENQCSLPGDVESVLCVHGGPPLPHDHWSCCGAPQLNSICTAAAPPDAAPPAAFSPPGGFSRKPSLASNYSAWKGQPSDSEDTATTRRDPGSCQVCAAGVPGGARRICRRCGCTACNACLARELRVVGQGMVRVCDPCFQEVAGTTNTRASNRNSLPGNVRASMNSFLDLCPASPSSVDDETDPLTDAPLAAALCIAAVASERARAAAAAARKKRKKRLKTVGSPPLGQAWPGAGGGFGPFGYQQPPPPGFPGFMPGTPQRDLSQQHPASSLFTPGAYGMWRNSGAAVPAAVYQNPAHRALPAPADNNNDRFWTDFIEEWDGVSKSIL